MPRKKNDRPPEKLPAADFRDPRATISEPHMIRGYRTMNDEGVNVGSAVWRPTIEAWHIVWANGQQIYVPSIDLVLSRLAGAGCDTITIERQAQRKAGR